MAVQIYVDADACPVKDEVVRVAGRHGLVVIFVANFGLRPSRFLPFDHRSQGLLASNVSTGDVRLPSGPTGFEVRNVVVPQGADAADDWIVEHAAAGDIVVTADIPLAGRALEKGAFVLGPTGKPFTRDSIGMALAMRELKQHLRETGESRGLNAEFTARDRSTFLQVLDEMVVQAKA
jgi:uncharacterized protein YaiI (UPF0178 family)